MTETTFEMFDARIRPFAALAATFRLLRNKEATHEVYRIIAALDGPVQERNFKQFEATDFGNRVLTEKFDLLDTMSKRDKLATLPVGSLGRTYLDFITRENLTAEGFQEEMDASGESYTHAGEDRQRFNYRSRHIHDLLHVLTGYGRDLIGELSLLSFSRQRTDSRGVLLILFFGYFKARKEYPGIRAKACMNEGARLGREATGLIDADWETLLADPLDKVRKQLNIGVPENYLAIKDRADVLDRQYRTQLVAGQA